MALSCSPSPPDLSVSRCHSSFALITSSAHTLSAFLATRPPQAKQVLDGYGASYKVIELNEIEQGYALRAELAGITGRTSVPALFVGGEFLGGCNDGGKGGVMTLDKAGSLKPMLASAGCIES